MLPLAARLAAARPTRAGEDQLRTIGALVAIILCALPALFAGIPGLQPAWFSDRLAGVPLSVVVMAALMLVFVILARLFSVDSGKALPDREGR